MISTMNVPFGTRKLLLLPESAAASALMGSVLRSGGRGAGGRAGYLPSEKTNRAMKARLMKYAASHN